MAKIFGVAPSELYELLLGEAETKDTIVKDVVENVDLIPSNVNLSGAEIELIGVDEKEYILKKIIVHIF